ncbi:hypothetical protein FUAX_47570 (plasmid) [Fulvitalea axinellae]|uniref:UPF0033 domain-containing protein n=1 Tax=Fulvitalea axinellae TaxID=1182444 RepID=A0AAU9DMA3_9BACT|nr:hypothetical protein FUAX_47570 [Fulvitalea axinellae]
MKVVDARGKRCPQPMIMAKRLWKTLADSEIFEVWVDNAVACENLNSFLADHNASPKSIEREGYTAIEARKPEKASEKPEPEAVCAPSNSAYTVVLKNDKMGHGDDALGEILIKGYINALAEIDKLPEAIVLYNAGVLLARKDSGASEGLAELSQKGVDIILCGACVDYYEIKSDIACGRISNMYVIAELLAKTGHIVYP